MKPYVGITGFMSRDQVQRMIDVLDRVSWPDSHLLMIGVLVSDKSVRGDPLKPLWINKYPAPRCAAELFIDDPRVLNLVHYNTKGGELAVELEQVRGLIPALGGFQLNIAWPEPSELRDYRKYFPDDAIVLQLGKRALAAIDFDPLTAASHKALRHRLEHYEGLIDYCLFDYSGGLGLPLLPMAMSRAVEGQSYLASCGIGIAGGLAADNLAALLERAIGVYPTLSWDAEGGLRTNDALDLDKCWDYLAASARLIRERQFSV